jgi:hypothetical protein
LFFIEYNCMILYDDFWFIGKSSEKFQESSLQFVPLFFTPPHTKTRGIQLLLLHFVIRHQKYNNFFDISKLRNFKILFH